LSILIKALFLFRCTSKGSEKSRIFLFQEQFDEKNKKYRRKKGEKDIGGNVSVARRARRADELEGIADEKRKHSVANPSRY